MTHVRKWIIFTSDTQDIESKVIKAHPLGSDALWCPGQTAALRSLWGNRTHRASEEPGCKSVEYEKVKQVQKWNSFLCENKYSHYYSVLLTLKHSSVAKSLAMEQRETASGRFSCSAVAASRTRRRDATNLVAISASLNWRNYTHNTDRERRKDRFKITFQDRWLNAVDLGSLDPCMTRLQQGEPLAWLLESVSPNCLRTNRWSFASCTQACAAPREQDAVGRVLIEKLLMVDHMSSK